MNGAFELKAMNEFELIKRHFRPALKRAVLGGGDDCALWQPSPGQQLAISSDMLVEGRHFLPTVSPALLGHKALAVNLSDLAACGAQPLAFTLALALPRIEESWLQAFSGGLLALARAHGCELIGGDTTRGPLNICITVFGEVPPGQALLRSGAKVKDQVWVSGALGGARAGLHALLGQLELPQQQLLAARQRLEAPEPRVALGLALRGLASAAADLSDGLMGDLGHILAASGVGARLHTDALLQAADPVLQAMDQTQALNACLCGGDDYELVFTAPPHHRGAVVQAAQGVGVALTCIGEVVEGSGLQVQHANGQAHDLEGLRSFDHFASP